MDLEAEYAEYKAYIDDFAKTIDPVRFLWARKSAVEFMQITFKFQDDQLPLRTAGYCLRDYEVHGEVTDWIITYLGLVKMNYKSLIFIFLGVLLDVEI